MKWKTGKQENVTMKRQSNLTQDELINVEKMQFQLAQQNKKMRFQMTTHDNFRRVPPNHHPLMIVAGKLTKQCFLSPHTGFQHKVHNTIFEKQISISS